MRTIDWSHEFKRDYRRERKTHGKSVLDGLLDECFDYLLTDRILPASYRDHVLSGRWGNYRDCHLKPDLVLIYTKIDAAPNKQDKEDILLLMRLGSHAEVFGG